MLKRGLAMTAVLSLSACAVFTDNEQAVAVRTPGVAEAGCALTSPTLTRYVKTPAMVKVDKSSGDISIICREPGYYDGIAILSPDYAKRAWRKLLFGKLTGVAISAATVGLNRYPKSIQIYMEKIPEDRVAPDDQAAALDQPRGRWVGTGDRDACGRAWVIELFREGAQISGRIRRESIEYQLRGEIDEQERMAETRAGRSVAYDDATGPDHLAVEIRFSEDSAAGRYRIDQADSPSCVTPFTLTRNSAR